MSRFSYVFVFSLFVLSCTPKEISNVLNTVGGISDQEVVQGLKEALDLGVKKGVDELGRADGFLRSAYKIGIPSEVRAVTDVVEKIPLFRNLNSKLEEKINDAASDAVKSAAPIFTSAIRNMTVQDGWNILKGTNNAATTYLEKNTRAKLYSQFQPIMDSSLNKFGVFDLWSDIMNTYNTVPGTKKVDPDLEAYVLNKALDGLFGEISEKEADIRANASSRITDVLRTVFAQQD